MGRMRSGLGRPEALRERQEFIRSDGKLIAKRQDLVLAQKLLQALDGLRPQGTRQVDSIDSCAEGSVQRRRLDPVKTPVHTRRG